jgi:hypothetical protein
MGFNITLYGSLDINLKLKLTVKLTNNFSTSNFPANNAKINFKTIRQSKQEKAAIFRTAFGVLRAAY